MSYMLDGNSENSKIHISACPNYAINSYHEAAQMSSVSSCEPLPVVRFYFTDHRFISGNLEWTETAPHIVLHIPDK